ncbi:hypothetical protein T265_10550 [Opisthorchis viverrini]|uniref:Uncharacterized protein n=1 Tax=Opisthorchis viverrini TaxID=6198 RepID=A0A074ZCV6_OPIVI|nr:hypothetical protein T265_10550 [Opisthorchis viverrini]KER21025.1 hypothetical protein T265_10550 [Opisthorchis viverrini]
MKAENQSTNYMRDNQLPFDNIYHCLRTMDAQVKALRAPSRVVKSIILYPSYDYTQTGFNYWAGTGQIG